ncbi:MAG: hypothetical protein Q8P41_11685 [Pseudomonadota bacterium]|nr:hypothetical protein [Pseudomonadota bacterium]
MPITSPTDSQNRVVLETPEAAGVAKKADDPAAAPTRCGCR